MGRRPRSGSNPGRDGSASGTRPRGPMTSRGVERGDINFFFNKPQSKYARVVRLAVQARFNHRCHVTLLGRDDKGKIVNTELLRHTMERFIAIGSPSEMKISILTRS